MPSQPAASLELPASPAAAARIGRREIFLWVAIGLFANQALLLVDVGSNRDFATSLAEQNYVFWLACYAVIYRLHASDRGVRATGFDCVLALAICGAVFLTSFLPYRFGIGLLATVTAGYLFFIDGGDRQHQGRRSGVAGTLGQPGVGALFQLFTPELLRADAAIVGVILTALRPDIVWSGNSFIGQVSQFGQGGLTGMP